MAVLWNLHRIFELEQHRGSYLTPCSPETPNESHWLSKQKENVREKCQSGLKISHISTRKTKREILTPVKLLEALALLSAEAGFHRRFILKAYQSFLRLPPVSP